MADVFKSQEVYKHVNYNLHDRNEMIAVRGVYVTGEYRPPYYNEPILALSYIRGIDTEVVNFETESADASNTNTVGMYKFGLSGSTYNIQRYSTESTDASNTNTVGMYKFGLTSSSYNIQRYEKDYEDASNAQTVGMYNFAMSNSQYQIIRSPIIHTNSTPEYGLGLSFLRTDSATVENFIP